jgi:Methyltransferase domain
MTVETAAYSAQGSGSGNTPLLSRDCRRYLSGGYRQVQGWASALALLELARLSQVQQTLGIRGPVCEIGVYLGRVLILLHLLTRPDELTAGVDLHERGPQVLRNLQAHRGDPTRLRLMVADSLQVPAERILELCAGRPRLFDIDAGRTPEAVYHDLTLARQTMCAGGVAIVDDYFQEAWPGISEGVCRFMTLSGGLCPLAIGGNKLFLTTSREASQAYRDRLAPMFAGHSRKAIMFGEPVLLIGRLTVRRRLARTKLWQSIRRYFR